MELNFSELAVIAGALVKEGYAMKADPEYRALVNSIEVKVRLEMNKAYWGK